MTSGTSAPRRAAAAAALMALMALAGAPGCGGGEGEQNDLAAESMEATGLRSLGEVYAMYQEANGKAPTSFEDIESASAAMPGGLSGIGADNTVVFWGTPLADPGAAPGKVPSDKVLAYEKKAPARVPADLADALKKNRKARTAFDAFSPSHKREYVQWITEAKREETRQTRIATAIKWISAGKSRNWKYE